MVPKDDDGTPDDGTRDEEDDPVGGTPGGKGNDSPPKGGEPGDSSDPVTGPGDSKTDPPIQPRNLDEFIETHGLEGDQAKQLQEMLRRETHRGIEEARKKHEKETAKRRYTDEDIDRAVEQAIERNNRTVQRRDRIRAITEHEFGVPVMDGAQFSKQYRQLGKEIAEYCDENGIDREQALSTDKGVRAMLMALGRRPAGGDSESPSRVEGRAIEAGVLRRESINKKKEDRDAWDDFDQEAVKLLKEQGAL